MMDAAAPGGLVFYGEPERHSGPELRRILSVIPWYAPVARHVFGTVEYGSAAVMAAAVAMAATPRPPGAGRLAAPMAMAARLDHAAAIKRWLAAHPAVTDCVVVTRAGDWAPDAAWREELQRMHAHTRVHVHVQAGPNIQTPDCHAVAALLGRKR
jgi:hypothetical protein